MCRIYPEITPEAVDYLNMIEIDKETNPNFRCVKCGRFLSWSHSKHTRVSPKVKKATTFFKCKNPAHGELLYYYNFEWEEPY